MAGALQPLKRGSLIGRYVVLEKLGAGGMGVVYAAYDPQLDRRIALKLLHRRSHRQGDESRLREARLMAQVTHPNVVAVYDVGVADDQVFIAMQHVPGRTLRQWLAAQKRSWREIVHAFVDAGRGLAAAHAAGVVHRDFKPDNVLIGEDGRARVTDFGVARLSDDDDATPIEAQLAEMRLFSNTTSSQGIAGSPGYISPEQLDGKEADARSDLFAFCVSLYEALAGVSPFGGANLWQRRKSIEAQQMKWPAGAAPNFVQRALQAGLSDSPSKRQRSMDELLRQLEPAERKPSRWLLGLIAPALLLLLLPIFLQRRERTLCRGFAGKLQGVWDGSRRASLQQARDFEVAARILDEYAQDWTAQKIEACEATRVRGEQSEQLLDLRMECLDRRLDALGALVDVLASGGAKVSATDAAQALPPLADCRNTSALRESAPLPKDPASKPAIESLRVQLTRAQALAQAGLDDRALALAQQAQKDAAAAGWLRLVSEADTIIARALTQSGDARGAEAANQRTAIDAIKAHDDLRAAHAWVALTWDVGHRQARFDDGRVWASYAGAAIERAGGDDRLEALRLRDLGWLDYDQGKLDEALAHFRKSQSLLESKNLARDELYALVIEGVAAVFTQQGRLDEALLLEQQSLKLREQVVGPEHPHVAFAEDQLVATLLDLGKPAEALQHAQRSLEIREKVAPNSTFLGFSISRIGYALHAFHRDEEALRMHQRALEVLEAKLGPQGRDLAMPLQGMGDDLLALRRPAEAIAPLERALALREKFGVDPSQIGDSRFSLAQALGESKRDPRRAKQLASSASEAYLRAASRGAHSAAASEKRVEEWLASQQ